MEFKEKLTEFLPISTNKQVDKRLIFLLGLFGILVVVMASWLIFSDWRYKSATLDAQGEGRIAVETLLRPVQNVKRLMADEQVQSIAVRAVNNKDTQAELLAYLQNEIPQVKDVLLLGTDLSVLNPEELGPNGYAVYDMALSTFENNKGMMQIHYVLQPPLLYDSSVVKSGDDVIGIMILALDPDYLLADVDLEYSSLGLISYTQYNGRQKLSHIKNWGDISLQQEVPDRIPVPGTLFRVEFPQPTYIGLISGGTALLAIIVGVACLLAAMFLFRANQKWRKAQRINEAKRKAMAPPPVAASQPVKRPVAPVPAITQDQLTEDEGEPDGGSAVTTEPPATPSSAAMPDPPPMRLKYNITERRKLQETEHSPVELKAEIFRAYDIRGVIDKTLDSGVARSVGQAVGTVALEHDAGPVVVARDGRLSGPYLMEGMIEGILSSGCDVLDIGAVPTGVLYYAAHEMGAGSGVMITGSHNPPDYNGFKVMIGGDPLHGETITDLYQRITAGNVSEGQGVLTSRNVVPDYIARIAEDIQVEREMKVVIDCGNGIGGVCAADALRAIGVEVLPLFDEVDGTFPNHHPDPSEPENLNDLIESVRLIDADLGLALDGDADRLGVVTLAGNIIYPDRIMMLLALDVLDRNPGATIIYDVKCTSHLPAVIKQAGGNPVMYKTGHSLIKARMKEIDSPFAGEMSGHFFFGERWYGVDDGIYAAARLLEILGSSENPPEAILNALPTSYSTPELKVHMQEGENHAFIEAFKAKALFQHAQINTIDGLRADFEDGWGLVRASNTTPILVVRFDAETEEALARIKATFKSQMLEVNPDLELPF